MLGLSQRENKFFRLFLLGHLLLAGGIFVIGFLPSCEQKPKEVHVFELASVSPTPLIEEFVKAKPTPPSPAPKPKVLPKSPPIQTPTQPTPKPKPKKPPVTPKPETPKAKPTTTPKPKPISYQEFRHKQNLPSPPKPSPISPKIQPVRLNPQDFLLPQIKVTSSPNSSSAISASAVNQYLAKVKSRLEGIWRQLLLDSPLHSGGEARLSFRISSSGSLVSAKLSKSSGNASLDRLVLEVARRSGVFGPPPGGRLDSALEIPFRVQ